MSLVWVWAGVSESCMGWAGVSESCRGLGWCGLGSVGSALER